MAKKATTPRTAVAAKTDNVVGFDLAGEAAQFAIRLGVELSGSVEDRADLAAEHMSRSQRHMLAAGVLLMSIKQEADHGKFTELLESRGFEERAAQRSMQYAQFVLSRPEDERAALIDLPKSKVLALAGADPEVIEAMLGGGIEKIDALSVRALTQEIAELKAGLADAQVQRDTAETEVAGLKKKLQKAPKERQDAVPMVIADLRAEIMAAQHKAALAIDAINALGVELFTLFDVDGVHDWADATLRLGASALGSIRLQAEGVLSKYCKALPGGDPTPSAQSYLSKQEVLETAQMFERLGQVDTYEKALREWERAQTRPKAKGRPAAKPQAPEGA